MGNWSVDGVQKWDGEDGKPLMLYRFVHVMDVDAETDRIPGVRYLLMDVDRQDPPQFGEVVRLDSKVLGDLERGEQTLMLRPGVRLEPMPDVQRELEARVRACFQEAREPTEDDGSSNAGPLLPKPRGGKGKPRAWARIHVHDVGQGDTIVLELPGGKLWLIDARLWGRPRRKLFKEWMRNSFGGRGFDRVIVSHLHYDHIHSIPWIMSNFHVGELVVPDSLHHPTSSAEKVLKRAGVALVNCKGQESLRFGAGLQVQLMRTADVSTIANSVTGSNDPNDHEIAVMLKTDASAAFLAGDICGDYCHKILKNSILNGACSSLTRYYKVSHHGSRTGFDVAFFQTYPSDYAVISCGEKNRYGHPHDPPVNRFVPHERTYQYRTGYRVCTYELQ